MQLKKNCGQEPFLDRKKPISCANLHTMIERPNLFLFPPSFSLHTKLYYHQRYNF
jgi:hypothetical protein